MCYSIFDSLLAKKGGRQMEKRRRNPQSLTAEQFEVFRTRLDEKGNVPPPQSVAA
jgi:hypothetical protein